MPSTNNTCRLSIIKYPELSVTGCASAMKFYGVPPAAIPVERGRILFQRPDLGFDLGPGRTFGGGERARDLQSERQPVGKAARDRGRRVLGQVERVGVDHPAPGIARAWHIVAARIGIGGRDRRGQRQQQIVTVEKPLKPHSRRKPGSTMPRPRPWWVDPGFRRECDHYQVVITTLISGSPRTK